MLTAAMVYSLAMRAFCQSISFGSIDVGFVVSGTSCADAVKESMDAAIKIPPSLCKNRCMFYCSGLTYPTFAGLN